MVTMFKHLVTFIAGAVFVSIAKIAAENASVTFSVSTHDLTIIVDESERFNLEWRGLLNQTLDIRFVEQHTGILKIDPEIVHLLPNGNGSIVNKQEILLFAVRPGHLDVTAKVLTPRNNNDGYDNRDGDNSHNNAANDVWNLINVFVRVTVANSMPIIYISEVVGWIYFLAWSVSFYPQIWINYRRQSVVGLNFDFLALNLVGFLLYGMFNMALAWSPEIQQEYMRRFPRGLIPVLLNDVVFSLHAMFATIITIIQCFIYQRDEQRVSKTAGGILGIFAVIVTVSAILAATGTVHWLDFLYYCSYIKLTITLIKYIPQAVMNYRRKSTYGWSIGNILLDFTGGILSMLQMMLNAYNYDDWSSIFGDPTKFGLGFFSVLFDIFFMVQHYILYRNPKKHIPDATKSQAIADIKA